jgi:tRNA G26 N,N-dimethylase Trm1
LALSSSYVLFTLVAEIGIEDNLNVFSIKNYLERRKTLLTLKDNQAIFVLVDTHWDYKGSVMYNLQQLIKALQGGGYNASPGITNFSPKGIKSKHRKVKH